MRLRHAALLIAFAAAPLAAQAPILSSPPHVGPALNYATVEPLPPFKPVTSNLMVYNQFREAMWNLRNKGLALRAADGGTLTPAHYAEIQRQLDAIQAKFHNQLRESDIRSANSSGNVVHSGPLE